MSEYAGVHLLDNPYFIDRAYDYFIPPDLRGTLREGDFVTVPFGNANHRRIGLVVALKGAPDDGTKDCKPILAACDRRMSLNEEMRELCFFMKEQTLCTVGDAVRAMIPASVLSHLEEVYRFSGKSPADGQGQFDAPTELICQFIYKRGSVRFDLLKSRFGPAAEGSVKKLVAAGLIKKDFEIRSAKEKSEHFCALAVDRARADAILTAVCARRRIWRFCNTWWIPRSKNTRKRSCLPPQARRGRRSPRYATRDLSAARGAPWTAVPFLMLKKRLNP